MTSQRGWGYWGAEVTECVPARSAISQRVRAAATRRTHAPLPWWRRKPLGPGNGRPQRSRLVGPRPLPRGAALLAGSEAVPPSITSLYLPSPGPAFPAWSWGKRAFPGQSALWLTELWGSRLRQAMRRHVPVHALPEEIQKVRNGNDRRTLWGRVLQERPVGLWALVTTERVLVVALCRMQPRFRHIWSVVTGISITCDSVGMLLRSILTVCGAVAARWGSNFVPHGMFCAVCRGYRMGRLCARGDAHKWNTTHFLLRSAAFTLTLKHPAALFIYLFMCVCI